jgi:hypothetical protein
MAKKPPLPGASPSHFFAREVAPEPALTLETAQRLGSLAADFAAHAPWKFLYDSNLVFADAPGLAEPHACSVMGALGEVFALAVYPGSEGYRFFRTIQEGDISTFLGEQRSLIAEYVTARELTGRDRELLAAVNYARRRGGRAPQFRSRRPGYHGWYVNEPEGQTLAECLSAMAAFLRLVDQNPRPDLWAREGVYPLMRRTSQADYQLEMADAPALVVQLPKLPKLDERRLQAILHRNLPSGGALQVDHFYAPAQVGGSGERKSYMRVALAIDAKNAFAYPPVLESPEANTGDMLASVVLGAIESSKALPCHVEVRSTEFKTILEPLAQALGFPVRSTDRLPALEFARQELLAYFGVS